VKTEGEERGEMGRVRAMSREDSAQMGSTISIGAMTSLISTI